MSKRNMIWLAAVIAVGAIVWFTLGVVAGLVAAALMLVISEVVERRARAQRRRASAADAAT